MLLALSAAFLHAQQAQSPKEASVMPSPAKIFSGAFTTSKGEIHFFMKVFDSGQFVGYRTEMSDTSLGQAPFLGKVLSPTRIAIISEPRGEIRQVFEFKNGEISARTAGLKDSDPPDYLLIPDPSVTDATSFLKKYSPAYKSK